MHSIIIIIIPHTHKQLEFLISSVNILGEPVTLSMTHDEYSQWFDVRVGEATPPLPLTLTPDLSAAVGLMSSGADLGLEC